FSLSALVSGIFQGAFAVLINSGENLNYLNISNRVTIICAMFTIVLSLHFYVSFFGYKGAVLLKGCYAICIFFSLLCLVPNQYFLAKEFYATSHYYTGLSFGPLFKLWGGWVLLLSVYSLMILVRIYLRQRKNQDNHSLTMVKLLLGAAIIWMITGLGDALTGIQVIDLPPLTWMGSFLVTCCIAWILVLHIDNLYEDRRLLSNRLMYDHLTQAFSRSYFEIRLRETIKTMQQRGFIGLYVCIFDIDDFKSVNDSYGHANGDQLLKGISSIAKDAIRPSDCFARLGGDEFVLLLTDVQVDSDAFRIVDGIRNSILKTSFGIGSHKFNASCSFGMAGAGPEHLKVKDLPSQLLSYADQALYTSKHQGKNAVSVTTLPLSESSAPSCVGSK
ncbi:MAG: diguanylate cyclase (GGDEF)-like protein, partial [Psychromonas sp.]